MRFHGSLAYQDYEVVALEPDEQSRLVRGLGACCAMILRNHGLLTAGSTVREAFDLIYYLERTCPAQISAQPGGGDLNECDDVLAAKVARQFPEPDSGALHD